MTSAKRLGLRGEKKKDSLSRWNPARIWKRCSQTSDQTSTASPCETPDLEFGFEKVAIFADGGGAPKHAARQLASGAWTSKLGDLEDIEHKTLEALEGEEYGKPVRFVKRALTGGE